MQLPQGLLEGTSCRRGIALVELWHISLNPTKQRRMVHLGLAVRQHAFEVAIADRELQRPAYRSQR